MIGEPTGKSALLPYMKLISGLLTCDLALMTLMERNEMYKMKCKKRKKKKRRRRTFQCVATW